MTKRNKAMKQPRIRVERLAKKAKGKEEEKKKTNIKRETKALEKQAKRDQSKNIKQALKTGRTETTTDTYKLTPATTRKAYQKLLEPLLKRKKDADMIIKNVHKIRGNIQTKTIITGLLKDGTTGTILEITETGRTIEQVKKDYTETIPRGTIITSTNWSDIKEDLKRRNKNAQVIKYNNGIARLMTTKVTIRVGGR